MVRPVAISNLTWQTPESEDKRVWRCSGCWTVYEFKHEAADCCRNPPVSGG